MSVLAVLAAAVLFGTTGTAQALGPDGTTPLSVGMARLVVGGGILGLLALGTGLRRRAAARPRPAARPDLALMALTAVAFVAYQPLFFLGTAANGVAIGTVVALGSAPVLAGGLEWALTRRAPSGVWLTATGAATLGVALLAFGRAPGDGGELDAVGLLGSVGAGASFAVFAVAQRRLLDRGWSALTVVGAMGGGAAVLAFPLLLTTDLSWIGRAGGIAMTLWLGLATTTLAYVLFTWGLQSLRAATAAALTLAEPLTAGLLGVLVLGEQLSPLAIIGVVVLAAGLALLAWGSRAPRDPALRDRRLAS
ncbi:DMT family transporter [Microbacterium sp. CJ88]|uniref:DMT family transporter n=1 Tax=Microbacterium sp. CJ88 TaxID=3445672 RepID=UPI003F65F9D0